MKTTAASVTISRCGCSNKVAVKLLPGGDAISSLTAIHIGKHTKPVSWPVRMNERFGGRGTSLRSPFVPVVRLYWGRQFAQTRWGKLHHLSQITDLFGSLGFSLDAEITKLWRKRREHS